MSNTITRSGGLQPIVALAFPATNKPGTLGTLTVEASLKNVIGIQLTKATVEIATLTGSLPMKFSPTPVATPVAGKPVFRLEVPNLSLQTFNVLVTLEGTESGDASTGSTAARAQPRSASTIDPTLLLVMDSNQEVTPSLQPELRVFVPEVAPSGEKVFLGWAFEDVLELEDLRVDWSSQTLQDDHGEWVPEGKWTPVDGQQLTMGDSPLRVRVVVKGTFMGFPVAASAAQIIHPAKIGPLNGGLQPIVIRPKAAVQSSMPGMRTVKVSFADFAPGDTRVATQLDFYQGSTPILTSRAPSQGPMIGTYTFKSNGPVTCVVRGTRNGKPESGNAVPIP